MLHAKRYFSFFGILASGVNMQLLRTYASLRSLAMLLDPQLRKKQNTIQNAVQNHTKIRQ